MPDGPHKKTKLNVRVPPAKKEAWKDALEDGENLTSLVQRAVDRELNDEYIPKNAIKDHVEGKNTELDLTPVTEQLNEIHQTVEGLEGKIDSISLSDTEGDEEEDIEDLAMDLLERLPAYPSDIPERTLREMGGAGGMDSQEYIKWMIETGRTDDEFPQIDGTAQRLAREMREPTPAIREALIYLETETTENVQSAIVEAKRHWVRGL